MSIRKSSFAAVDLTARLATAHPAWRDLYKTVRSVGLFVGICGAVAATVEYHDALWAFVLAVLDVTNSVCSWGGHFWGAIATVTVAGCAIHWSELYASSAKNNAASSGGDRRAERIASLTRRIAATLWCFATISAFATAVRSAEPLDAFQKTALIAIFVITAGYLILALVYMMLTTPGE